MYILALAFFNQVMVFFNEWFLIMYAINCSSARRNCISQFIGFDTHLYIFIYLCKNGSNAGLFTRLYLNSTFINFAAFLASIFIHYQFQ